jgi:hypothetical protein
MIEWVVATMRDVKVALEKANLNGFVYDASFQLHHKKPGVSPMQRNPKTISDGGKTRRNKLPRRHSLYVTSAAASMQWMLVAEWVFPIRMRTHR